MRTEAALYDRSQWDGRSQKNIYISQPPLLSHMTKGISLISILSYDQRNIPHFYPGAQVLSQHHHDYKTYHMNHPPIPGVGTTLRTHILKSWVLCHYDKLIMIKNKNQDTYPGQGAYQEVKYIDGGSEIQALP
jgi:hypothetical protein